MQLLNITVQLLNIAVQLENNCTAANGKIYTGYVIMSYKAIGYTLYHLGTENIINVLDLNKPVK